MRTAMLRLRLAGTQVLVKGKPVPRYSVSASLVSAITPFGLSPSTAQIQVVYNAQTSAPVTVPVAPRGAG